MSFAGKFIVEFTSWTRLCHGFVTTHGRYFYKQKFAIYRRVRKMYNVFEKYENVTKLFSPHEMSELKKSIANFQHTNGNFRGTSYRLVVAHNVQLGRVNVWSAPNTYNKHNLQPPVSAATEFSVYFSGSSSIFQPLICKDRDACICRLLREWVRSKPILCQLR